MNNASDAIEIASSIVIQRFWNEINPRNFYNICKSRTIYKYNSLGEIKEAELPNVYIKKYRSVYTIMKDDEMVEKSACCSSDRACYQEI